MGSGPKLFRLVGVHCILMKVSKKVNDNHYVRFHYHNNNNLIGDEEQWILERAVAKQAPYLQYQYLVDHDEHPGGFYPDIPESNI